MKIFKCLFSTMFVASLCLGFTACSDDDDDNKTPNEPSVDDVLPAGAPKSIGDAVLTVNEKGQLTKVVDGDQVITIEYGSFSRATTYDALLKLREAEDSDNDYDAYLKLNGMGYVTDVLQVYKHPEEQDGKQSDTWKFTYNDAGQLSRLQRSESGDDFKITYTNGDITKVEQTDEDGDHKLITIVYTNAEYPEVKANTSGVMEFDESFRVDMDEMGFLYYAGMLGQPTKNLPMGNTEKATWNNGEEYTFSDNYNWEFGANGFPTKFWTDNDGPSEIVTFVWN